MDFNTTVAVFAAATGYAIAGLFGAAVGVAIVTGIAVALTLYAIFA